LAASFSRKGRQPARPEGIQVTEIAELSELLGHLGWDDDRRRPGIAAVRGAS